MDAIGEYPDLEADAGAPANLEQVGAASYADGVLGREFLKRELLGGGDSGLPPVYNKGGKLVGSYTRSGRIKYLPPPDDNPKFEVAEQTQVTVDPKGFVVSYLEDDGTVVELPQGGK